MKMKDKKMRMLCMLALLFLVPFSIQAQDVDLNRGLVAYYPFDGNANDVSGYGNNGYVYNATLTEGREGQGYHFGDAPESMIRVLKSDSPSFNDAASFSFWFKIDQFTDKSPYRSNGSMIFFWKGVQATLTCTDNNSFEVKCSFEKNQCQAVVEGDAINNWYHAVMIATNNEIKFFINGTKVASVNNNIDINALNSSDLIIGRGNFNGHTVYGCLDDFLIYNRELSNSEVTALFDGQKPDKTKILPIKKTPEPLNPSEKTIVVNSETFVMKFVKGGEMTLGNTFARTKDDIDFIQQALGWHECPHKVIVSDYYIGVIPVTEAVWTTVMGSNPSSNPALNAGFPQIYPVENVSWFDCQAFIEKLNQLTGENFRLPTEAEWEYAARGGQNSKGYLYSGTDDIGRVANREQSKRNNFQTGNKGHCYLYEPNELGLYSMSGCVFEWCSDWLSVDYILEMTQKWLNEKAIIKDPQGPSSGDFRVMRGGSFDSTKTNCMVYSRWSNDPGYKSKDIGLRLVLPAKKEVKKPAQKGAKKKK